MTTHSARVQDQAGTSEPPGESPGADNHSRGGSGSRSGTGSTRIHWPRWGWLPYLLIAAFVGFWALTHIGAVVSGAGSAKAVTFGIAAGLLTLGLLVGVARLTRRGWTGQLAGLVPLVAAVTVAVLPSYLSTSVSEAAPEGLNAAAPPPSSTAPEASTGSAPSAEPSSAPPAQSSAPAPEPSGPIEVGTAQFVGIDHEAAGVARLIQLEDGSLLVRFEQFSVESGPDYDVYVVVGANVSVPDGGTLLGDLKGTVGDQNYEIPAGAVPGDGVEPLTVLIWCEVFAVPVANATL